MRKNMKKEGDIENEELRECVKHLTLTKQQLEEALKQKDDCQAEKTQPEGELETAKMDIDDLRQQLCQEQTANAAGKNLQEKLTAEVTLFQSQYNKVIQSIIRLHERNDKLEEECKDFLEQLKTKQCNQQANAVSHPQQEQPYTEQQRLQQALDKEIQSHNKNKSLINKLEKENKRLKNYDNFLKDIQKKVEECKEEERRINILHCQLQDRAMTKVDQECQCKDSVVDQEEVNITLQKLQEQLKNEEQDKEYYKAHLDGLFVGHKRTCEWLDHYILENNELKSYIEVLEEYQCKERVMDQKEVNITVQKLQEQLKNEEQDKEFYKARMDSLCVEYERTCVSQAHYVLENHKLKSHIQVLEEKQKQKDNMRALREIW